MLAYTQNDMSCRCWQGCPICSPSLPYRRVPCFANVLRDCVAVCDFGGWALTQILIFPGIVLTRMGYYTIPSLEELARMTSDTGECIVTDFTVGRKGERTGTTSTRVVPEVSSPVSLAEAPSALPIP